jgi:hypothetical protein
MDNEEEIEADFKIGADGDESLDMPEDLTDFGLDEEDPDKDK